jgi:hypothetical protein
MSQRGPASTISASSSEAYEVAKVRELNWALQARLWQEILASERPASLVAVPSPGPTATPPTETSPPETSPQAPVDKAEKDLSSNSSEDEECVPLCRKTHEISHLCCTEKINIILVPWLKFLLQVSNARGRVRPSSDEQVTASEMECFLPGPTPFPTQTAYRQK